MVILGIDPGIARMGWGVVEEIKQKPRAIAYGCFETTKDTPHEERLRAVHNELTRLIKKYKPDVLAVEELFFNTNAKTAFIVGQARGVILLSAAQQNLEIATYTPLQVKMAITGYGRAEKAQIGQMVKVLLKLKEIPRPDDVADALAVALTYAFTNKFKEK